MVRKVEWKSCGLRGGRSRPALKRFAGTRLLLQVRFYVHLGANLLNGVCVCKSDLALFPLHQGRNLPMINEATFSNDDLCEKNNYEVMKSYVVHVTKGVGSSRELASCKEHRATGWRIAVHVVHVSCYCSRL